MSNAAIMTWIKEREGCNLDVRKRVNDNGKEEIFVGYGHNVLPSDNLNVGDVITKQRAEEMFNHDFFWFESKVKQCVKDYDSLPEGVKLVLCDIGYNNGIAGLKDYKKMIESINNRQWAKAADEIVDSYNYRRKDLHTRYVKLEQTMRVAV